MKITPSTVAASGFEWIEEEFGSPGDADKEMQGVVISGITKLLVAYVSACSGPVPQAHEDFIEMIIPLMRQIFRDMNLAMEALTPRKEINDMRRCYRIQTLKEKSNAELN